MTLSDVASTVGLHVNTVREHLDALLAAGLATREAAPPQGRGRPAWLYRAVPRPTSAVMEYAGLASALATAIHRTSRDPVDDAVAAGEDWGAELARTAGSPAGDGEPAARAQVVAIFDRMGFAPQPDAAHREVRLTRCPLLDAAMRHPDIVCGVHLGIARGAMAAYAAEGAATDLRPFAEPGACLLHLGDGDDR